MLVGEYLTNRMMIRLAASRRLKEGEDCLVGDIVDLRFFMFAAMLSFQWRRSRLANR
jgi:hypothetical protein